MARGAWEFWIDRGGTFTDVVALAPDGRLLTKKLLSETPAYEDAALEAIRQLLGVSAPEPLPRGAIASVKIGTTVATNALLERKGERVLLVTTRGFRDQLRIGYQNRPKLFVRRIDLPQILFARVLEVDERVTTRGEVLAPLAEASAERALLAAYREGYRACAILLLHGYRYPAHEARLAALAKKIGFTQISASHIVSPLMKYVSRGDTTVVDAYLTPILRRYVDRVAGALPSGPGAPCLMFMQSNGGLTEAARFQGKDAIFSGPAGGVVGVVETARRAGFQKLIGFDMGGTSTDVSHYDGAYERAYETEVAGVRLRAPLMAIHTVAAGGGSILSYDGNRMRAGPESAGASPGPACYRNGGPLTVTDANVMTGRIAPDFFPRVFGKGGDQGLDAEIVAAKFGALSRTLGKSPEETANGFLDIAVANMAGAIKKISVARGYDVTGYVLACFGGAGGQLACRVADALSMTKVLIHPFAGVLSAFGMGLADVRAYRDRAIEAPLATAELEEPFAGLTAAAVADIRAQGITRERISVERSVHLRYEGTDTALVVPFAAPDEMQRSFAEAHRRRFGFLSAERGLIVESISAEAIGRAHVPTFPPRTDRRAPGEALSARRIGGLYSEGRWLEAPIYAREDLKPHDLMNGPALIVEPHSTIVIESGWRAMLTEGDDLVLARLMPLPARTAIGTKADPVMLEVFNNRFMSIAEQMGVTLEKTASSVNIKERLDFSCALYDGEGNLIANAPHMPVHLGSMGASVAAVRAKNPNMRRGDVFAVNAPYGGGTHLPDVTVVMPVFDEKEDLIRYFVAARGHHGDIGGSSPGSMPPFSRTVEEEGVLLDGFHLVDQGRFREQALLELLTSGKYPARNPAQNITDMKAQVAACMKGADELYRLVFEFGQSVVAAYMQHVQDNAEEAVRRVIGALRDGAFEVPMDGGARIKVKVSVDHKARSATIDFTGTSPEQPNNFNAPRPVTTAAVLYVFRCLVDDDIPLNAGCLKPLEIVVPEGSMLAPRYPAAVVAGNVETSQAITDALFGALGVMAAAQGTMNNLTFGNERHQYYETICGGSGAGPGFDGQSAVHTHMTNSRLTDPEVLEWRFPVLVKRFEIRAGSGGAGRHRGGDGVVRELEFREPMSVAILSTRRETAPFGLAGGADGAMGQNTLRRADGSLVPLNGCDQAEVGAGDAVIIETPGGGGYGRR